MITKLLEPKTLQTAQAPVVRDCPEMDNTVWKAGTRLMESLRGEVTALEEKQSQPLRKR